MTGYHRRVRWLAGVVLFALVASPAWAGSPYAPVRWSPRSPAGEAAGWSLVGVGSAMSIVGAAFVFQAPGMRDDAAAYPLEQQQERRDRADRLNVAGWSVLGVGTAAWITGLVVLRLTVKKPSVETTSRGLVVRF